MTVDQRLAAGVTVVTATARLAREVQRRFDRHQLARGKRAWRSADVLPWGAWLQRAWRGRGGATLLDALQVTATFSQIIADDVRARDAAPLWNVHSTAAAVTDAWRILNAWQIDLDACARSSFDDHQCFVRWARRYQKLCEKNSWIDPYRLADALRADDGVRALFDAPVELAGFDSFLPQQQKLIDALKKTGVDISVADAGESVNKSVVRRRYADQADEWLSAARWARAMVTADPGARVAIVAPDLNRAGEKLEYALQQILCPQRVADPGVTADLPYHLSLGRVLARHPVAAAALTLLAPFAGAPLTAAALGRFIRSPFLKDAEHESSARAQLEAWCRRRLPHQVYFHRFVKALGDGHAPACPSLLKTLRAVSPLLDDASRKNSAAHFAHRFADYLKQVGWPGERALDSDEFQAKRALQKQLRNLALLDLTAPPLTAAAALSWLRRRADEQAFQAAAADAPVQALGVVDAAGQRFDGVWFGGLSDADWPPPARPNPFIAAGVQREAGVTEASLDANRALAALKQRRLIADGAEVVLSWPAAVDEVAVTPSALINVGGDGDDGVVVGDDGDDADRAGKFLTPATLINDARPELLSFTDARAPAVMSTDSIGGGASLIENQAKCPFRAFAVHRLGARAVEQNEQGLDAGERGALIHHALQLVWEKISSSKNLHDLGDDALQKIIHDAAEQAGRRYLASSGCGKKFHAAQTEWVAAVTTEWLAMEKQRREKFKVAAVEQQTEFNLNGLQLTFKIDRVDELADGAHALIDYKTGAPPGVANWGGARPLSPQLPLYALAFERGHQYDAPVAALAYGKVRRGDCGFTGVARDDAVGVVGALAGSRLKREFADWDALLAHWRAALADLAQEFMDGDARVAPASAAVCAECDLHGLCRVGDGAQSAP